MLDFLAERTAVLSERILQLPYFKNLPNNNFTFISQTLHTTQYPLILFNKSDGFNFWAKSSGTFRLTHPQLAGSLHKFENQSSGYKVLKYSPSTLSVTSTPKWEWAVKATPRPLYPRRKRPGPYRTGGWVDLRVRQEVCGNSRSPPPHRDSIPDTPARRETLHLLSYPDPAPLHSNR